MGPLLFASGWDAIHCYFLDLLARKRLTFDILIEDFELAHATR